MDAKKHTDVMTAGAETAVTPEMEMKPTMGGALAFSELSSAPLKGGNNNSKRRGHNNSKRRGGNNSKRRGHNNSKRRGHNNSKRRGQRGGKWMHGLTH